MARFRSSFDHEFLLEIEFCQFTVYFIRIKNRFMTALYLPNEPTTTPASAFNPTATYSGSPSAS